MAVTDVNSAAPLFDPARLAKNLRDTPVFPAEALARLPVLHGEACRNMGLAQFLARSPLACTALMVAGGALLAWESMSGDSTLKAGFAWAGMVLIGIVAMTRNFIRGQARSLQRMPLQEAASDLRMLLLYTGTAWGIGAFLIMPEMPAPALVLAFALGPSLALALILKDDKGVTAFTAPVTLATAGAVMLGAWPLYGWVTALTLTGGIAIMAFVMLQCAMRLKRNALPPLALP